MGKFRTIRIFAEGPADVAVLENVLHGAFQGEDIEILPVLPELDYDETDRAKAHLDPNSFSSRSVIKKECIEKTKLREAVWLSSGQDLIVIHLDAAERHDYNLDLFPNPTSKADCAAITCGVGMKMAEWLHPCEWENLIFAVAVNETDAWLLAHYDDQKKETGTILRPKEAFRNLANKKNMSKKGPSAYRQFQEFSKPLGKRKKLEAAAERNVSLQLFLRTLDHHSHPSSNNP
jgi:hypothetical protein